MAATVFETSNEKVVSGALALVMHSLFFAMLIFSVTWKKPEPVAMVAELWSSLPPVVTPRVEPPPPPKVEPEPPKPAPKVVPKPIPKSEPKPEPKPQPKAEIDLREKKEKEKKAKEQAALEKKKREEEKRAEALKQQQAKEAREAAEAKRLAQEQADAQKKLAQQQAAAQAREIDKYKQAIAARIQRFIVEPPNVQGNPVAELNFTMLPGGEVLDVRTRKSSGQVAWDNACERAIRRAQPLPLPPPDSPIFREFRELTHACRYKE
jgi:colicin import membrane protein